MLAKGDYLVDRKGETTKATRPVIIMTQEHYDKCMKWFFDCFTVKIL